MDRAELAAFLRDRRARVQPADVGLPAGRRRRTAGLRREELARLAGISVDYCVRLEQARGARPSRQVLTALARALRLSDDEHAHLLHLGGEVPAPPGVSRDIPARIVALLDRLDDVPAMVLDAQFDILAWNAMATALYTDFSAFPPKERNVVRWHFRYARTTMDGDEADRLGREVVADLRAGSAEFAALWSAREIAVQRSTVKRMHHPTVGELELDSQTLVIPERDHRLVFYTAAPGTPSHRALQLLKVVGTQQLEPEPPDPADRETVDEP